MKSLIKSSFFLILLMAVFNIGLTNAYAEDAKATNTEKIENPEIEPLKFSIDECEEATIERDDGTIVIVESDCDIVIIQ